MHSCRKHSSASVPEEGLGDEAAYLKILLCKAFQLVLSFVADCPQFCTEFDKSVVPNSFIRGLSLISIIFSDLP